MTGLIEKFRIRIAAARRNMIAFIKRVVRKKVGVLVLLEDESFSDEIIHHVRNIAYVSRVMLLVRNPLSIQPTREYFEKKLHHARSVICKCQEGSSLGAPGCLTVFAAEILSCDMLLAIRTPGPEPDMRSSWRNALFDLAGSPKTAEAAYRLIRNKKNGLVYPQGGQTDAGGFMLWLCVDAIRPFLADGFNISHTGQDSGKEQNPGELIASFIASRGFGLHECAVQKDCNNISLYYRERPYPPRCAADIIEGVKSYKRLKKKNHIVVYTAIIGEYDSLIVPEVIDPDIDYVCFSDRPRDGFGVFEIRPVDYYNTDPVKIARYVKTHPHKYFPEHDVSIWIDANVLIRGDLKKYVNRLKSSGEKIGCVAHPRRNCAFVEAESCKELGKDDNDVIDKQMERYRGLGFMPDAGLIETNIFVCLHHDPVVQQAFGSWWNEIERYSRRDQLSVMYALKDSGLKWFSLFEENYSLRNHYDFALFRHGKRNRAAIDGDLGPVSEVADPLSLDAFYEHRKELAGRVAGFSIDIVVCVHNALEDTIRCLDSVFSSMREGHTLIIVDDCSDERTRKYLDEFIRKNPGTRLFRNEQALGYTRSANIGLKNSKARLVILLNSDTIVPADWSLKMADAVFSNPTTGIVGPISNAAGYQSIPQIKSTATQTAVNPLPPGLTVEEVDSCCEKWSRYGLYPSVPLVHGFCIGIRREVIDRIGYFDEESFPKGYSEENDYCLKAADAGFDLVIATNTFVFHSKSKSYKDDDVRIELMKAGRAALTRKHGDDRIRAAIANCRNHPLLVELREKSLSIYY